MKKKTIILILILSLLCAGMFGFLTSKKYVDAQETFDNDGYILGTTAGEDVSEERYYFLQGSKYQQTYSGTITFNDINKNKVSIDSKSFVHYDDDSLFGLDDSVLMDTDDINDKQISYYSISSDSILTKSGQEYRTSNAGTEIGFSNFIWKISNERYMVVSDKITLFASEKDQQEFDKYIELEYVDAGVVRLINKEGTYSTISSDAYLELINGYRLYLGSKNVSDGEAIVMNLTEMVVNSDDNIEIIPDETYKKENVEQPQIVVNATDGEDGTEGENGDAGDQGKQMTDVPPSGSDGSLGAEGDIGDPGNPGVKGNQGAAGTSGTVGDPGDAGNDAYNSGIAYIEDIMPSFSLDGNLDITAYSVNGLIKYDNTYIDLDGNEQSIVMGEGKSVTYMIVENENSNIVWQRTVDPENELSLTDANYLTGVTSLTGPVHTLKQNTQYSLLINATYHPVSYIDGEEYDLITKQVFNQPFTTLGYGVDMTLDHTTEHEIFMNIKIDELAVENMNYFNVELYNSQRELLDYEKESYSFEILNEDENEIINQLIEDSTGNKIVIQSLADIEELQYPLELQVKFSSSSSNEIKRNTVYYGKINILELVNKNPDSEISIYPPDSLNFVRAKTHKIKPTIAVPTLSVYDNVNAISVMPGYVDDPDGGIQKYRYVFYEVVNGEINRDVVVHSVEKMTNEAFSLKVFDEDDPENNTNLFKKHTYVCETIGIFDNNEYIEDIFSGESNPIDLNDSSIWPEVTFNFNVYQYYEDQVQSTRVNEFKTIYDTNYKDKSSPSVIEGTIVIEDIGGIIDKSSELVISYLSESGEEPISGSYTVPVSDPIIIVTSQNNHNVYSFPFLFKNLREGTNYKATLSINHAIIRDPENPSDYSIESGVKIGTGYTSTANYMPLYFSGVSCDSDEINNESFKTKLYFSLDPDKYIEQKAIKVKFSDYAKSIIGIEDTVDLSAKSLHYVSFDLYKATSEGEPISNGKLNESPLIVYIPTLYDTTKHTEEQNRSYYSNWYKALNENDFYGIKTKKYIDGYITDEDGYATAYIKDDMSGNYSRNVAGDLIVNANMPDKVDDLDVVYTIMISDKSFVNDDGLTNLIAEYRKSNPKNDILIRATAAYDYTYAKGIANIQPLPSANKIQIGEYTEDVFANYRNQLYDVWVPTSVYETVPEWREDSENYFKVTEILKSYFKKNGRLYEEDFDCYSNLPSEDKDKLTTYWRENVSSSTTVGYAIQGNSNWLASFADAVRYSVYDLNGNLITRSYNNSTETRTVYEGEAKEYKLGEDGWIPCTNPLELPQWVLYMDQSTYTVDSGEETITKTLKRGDEFKVEMEVILKDISYKGPDEITYSYLYPYNYDEDEHNKHISFEYIIPKQKPTILTAQYDGNFSNGSNDEHYIFIKDTDKALDYDGNNLVVYRGTDADKINIVFNDTNKYGTIPFLYKVKFDASSDGMYCRYDLDGINKGSINFVSEHNLDRGADISLENINIIRMNELMAGLEDEYKTTFDETKDWGKVIATNDTEESAIRVYAETNCDSETFMKGVKNVEVEFINSNPDSSRKARNNSLVFNFDAEEISKGGFYSFTNGDDDNKKYYVIFRTPEIFYSDLSNICNTDDVTNFNIKVRICNETNNYGLKYTDASLFGDITSRGYLLEPSKDLGILNRSDTNSIYKLGDIEFVKTKSVIKDLNDYDDEYKIYLYDNITHEEARFKLDMYSEGLEYIPREVLYDSANKEDMNEIIIQAVIPEASVKITKPFGMYSGAFDIQLNGRGTMSTDKGITVRLSLSDTNYTDLILPFSDSSYEDYETYESKGISIKFDADNLKWNIESQSLIPNQQYTVGVYADFKTGVDSYETKELNKVTGQNYKTLPELDIISSLLKRVECGENGRDKKTVTETVTFRNLYIWDVNQGVTNVALRVNNTTEGHESVVFNYTYSKDAFIKELIKQNYPGIEDKDIEAKIREVEHTPGTYSLSYTIDWKPNDDKSHILGENWSYAGFIDITYGSSNKQTRNINTDPEFNDDLELLSPFRAIGSIPVDQTGDKYTINYDISGVDTKRILVGNHTVKEGSDDNVTYVLELHQKTSDGFDHIVDVTDDTTDGSIKTLRYPVFEKVGNDYDGEEDVYTDANENKYIISGYENHDVYLYTSKMLNKSGKEGSTIEPKQFSLLGEHDSTYYVKVYSIADIHNIDILGITEGNDGVIHEISYEEGTETKKALTFDALYDLDIVNANASGVYVYTTGSDEAKKETPYYVYIGGEIKTPSNPNVDVEAINLTPKGDNGIVDISGNYLYKVSHVRYQLTEVIREKDKDDKYIEHLLFPAEGESSATIWNQSAGGSKTYNLTVNKMTNPNNKYLITVYLYTVSADGEHYELASTVEGVYTPADWDSR